jgi:hypothetical protein
MAKKKTPLGRPELLPWSKTLPELLILRAEGSTYPALADILTTRYNTPITAQTVRQHVQPALTQRAKKSNTAALRKEKQLIHSTTAHQLATWLVSHQGSTKAQAAAELHVSESHLDTLMPTARKTMNGYLIPPARQREKKYSDKDMSDALRLCMKESLIPKNVPLTQSEFTKWRQGLPARKQNSIPNPLAYRRRYGSWTTACLNAGITATPLRRDYNGLTPSDIVTWLAHWLRSYTYADYGLVDMTIDEYGHWLANNPEAPSFELIRLQGTWTDLLNQAAILESTTRSLPKLNPVQRIGRHKKSS